MWREGRLRLTITRAIVWAIAAIAAGVLLWAIPGAVRFGQHAPGAFWAMAGAALLVDIPLFWISARDDLRVRSTMSVCFTFAIFMLWGAAPAIVVQAAAGAVTVIGQRYQAQASVSLVSRLLCAVGAAELVVGLVDGHPVARPGAELSDRTLLTFLLLSAVFLAVSYSILVVTRASARPAGLRQAAAEVRLDLVSTAAAVIVVSPLLTRVPGWWSLVVAAPLMVLNWLSRRALRQQERIGREPISGLLNQQGLAGGLQGLTAFDVIAPDGPRPFGIVMINIEAALTVNRTLGRETYEKTIGLVSRRLVDAYGPNLVGRPSTEGVVVLLPDLTEADAVDAAQAATEVLAPPIEVDDIPIVLDPVAGVALSPQHGRVLDTLLAKAELAATRARREGRRALLFVRQADETTARRKAVLREIRDVLRDPARHGELALCYQPQVELATGRLSGAEALVRWTHPQWGPVPTDELVEAVETTELMHQLTRHVLNEATDQLRRWVQRGDRFRVAVNVSAQDLHEPGFVDELVTLLHRQAVPPGLLTIEITERMLITDLPRVCQVAAQVRRLGLGLSLDDFGTGHASLQQLRQLPLTEVKVDRSYVSRMVADPADRAIVGSVHQLARALDVAVVAEGVEDEPTARLLAQLPGTIGQGYHLGRPMPADDLAHWRPPGRVRTVPRRLHPARRVRQ